MMRRACLRRSVWKVETQSARFESRRGTRLAMEAGKVSELQCWTAKLHNFASSITRFFRDKSTSESNSKGLKTSKNTLFRVFPWFLEEDILKGHFSNPFFGNFGNLVNLIHC